MKKTVLSLSLLLMSVSLFSQNISDGSFENWTENQSPRGVYLDYANNIFRTLNSLYEIPDDPIRTELTAFREASDVQHGQYAIRLESVSFDGIIFVPGAFGTIGDDVGAEFVAEGGITVRTEFVHKPLYLNGYYKYLPVAGDSAAIELELYYYDLESIAKTVFIEPDQVSNWKPFKIPINYTNDYTNPTHLKLIFSASAAYNFDDLENCRGQIGSKLFIDNLSFQYDPEGLEEPLLNRQTVKVFPNPASDIVKFDLGEENKGELVIYNLLGAEIARMSIENRIVEYNVSELVAGNYFYRVIDGKIITSSGKFIVGE